MNKDTMNRMNFRTLCHTLRSFVLLPMLAITILLVISTSNIKPVFAQESITPGGDEDNLLDQEWTGEIQFRNLIDQLPPGIIGSLSDESRFTGTLSFKLTDDCQGKTHPVPYYIPDSSSHFECITGSGKGYFFANGKTHVRFDSPNLLAGEDCWKNVEGPATFDVDGSYSPIDIASTPENETQRIFLYFSDKTTAHGRYGCSYTNARSSVQGFEEDFTGGIFKSLTLQKWPNNHFPIVTDRVGNSQRIEGIPNYNAGGMPLVVELKDGAKIEHNVGNNYVNITLHGPDCDAKPETPQFKPYSNGFWRANFGVVDREGLVLKDVKIGNAHHLDSLSMPHSKVVLSNDEEHYVRYCSSTDKHSEPQMSGDSLRWSFTREFGGSTPDVTSDDGVLSISYNFVLRSGSVQNCEGGHNTCLRFIPMVSFRWDGKTAGTLKQFTAYYKLDYGDGTGLVLVKDSVSDLPVGFRQFLQNERSFNAVKNGVGGDYDNLHTGHVGDYVNIPGCRASSIYDCLHMHWRWGAIVDPLVDPVNNENDAFPRAGGDPYLVPGQTIDIAVVKASSDPSEEDPDEPSTLVGRPGEAIAVNALGKAEGCPRFDGACLKSAEHPIVWYISSVENKISTTFFRHGLFSLDTR